MSFGSKLGVLLPNPKKFLLKLGLVKAALTPTLQFPIILANSLSSAKSKPLVAK